MELLIAGILAILGTFAVVWTTKTNFFWMVVGLFGMILRFLLAIGHRYYFTLPQGASDARVFQRHALDLSESGCGAFFEHVDVSRSYVYSSMLAEFFSCIGYSPLGAQFLNGIAGILAIIFVARGAEVLWGRKVAGRVILICALFPPLIIMSAVTLRESLIFLFFSIGMWKAIQTPSQISFGNLIVGSFWFTLAGLLHPGMFAALPGLLLARIFQTGLSKSHTGKSQKFLIIRNLILTCILILPVLPLIMQVEVNKIGSIENLKVDEISVVIENRASGGAAYLQGLSLNNPVDIAWQAPIRMVYFIFSPFLWDIRSPTHIFALTDSLLYFFVIIMMYRYRIIIFSRDGVLTGVIVLLLLIFVFSMGTSNFGTGMRHRSKFAPWLLAVGGPVLFKFWRKQAKETRKIYVQTKKGTR